MIVNSVSKKASLLTDPRTFSLVLELDVEGFSNKASVFIFLFKFSQSLEETLFLLQFNEFL